MTTAPPFFRASALALCTGLLLGATGAGCADPSGEYNAFVERWDRIHSGDAGPLPEASTEDGGDAQSDVVEEPVQCDRPAAADVAPYYYVALSATLAVTKPIMFLGTLTWDGSKLNMSFQPLDRTDHKTPEGNPVVGGPFDINSDGSFEADMGLIKVTGNANPISGSDIETTGVLHAGPGQFCKPMQFICGSVTGTIAKPIAGYSLDGSTFTMTAMDSATAFPAGKVVIDCAGNEALY